MVKKVGRNRALRMMLLGECVHGEEEARDGATYADTVAGEGETALEATMRFIAPLLELPCSQSTRAIKKVVSAADGDVDVIDSSTGMLKLDENASMQCEFASFSSVWGGKSNIEQIQKAKQQLRGERENNEK